MAGKPDLFAGHQHQVTRPDNIDPYEENAATLLGESNMPQGGRP